MNYILDIYGWRQRPVVTDYDTLLPSPDLKNGCLVLIDTSKPQAAALKAKLEATIPNLKVRRVTDLSGKSAVWVIDPVP